VNKPIWRGLAIVKTMQRVLLKTISLRFYNLAWYGGSAEQTFNVNPSEILRSSGLFIQ